MDNNLELLSIGDASVDTFITPTETELLCKIDTKDCWVCFSYGDKIPVRNLEFTTGGNAANNAVGVSRMGIKTGIVLTLGDDHIGNQIVDGLKKEKIDLTFVIQQPATSSNYSTVISYGGERTIFVYHAPRSYEFPVQLPLVPWVYLTSMGETFRPFYNHLANWLRQNPSVKLAFNPGSWQLKAGVEVFGEILSLTHVLYVNREEAEKITGFEFSRGKEKDLLSALTKLGPKIPIVTDGDNGSFAFDGSRFLKSGVLPVDAYERTGAGDAFGSGSLSAIIKGRPLEEALLRGTINSASVIGYIGPQKGLLFESQIEEWVKRAISSGVKVDMF